MLTRRIPPEQRFWKQVVKGDGCWEWSGSLSSSGYGQLTLPNGANGRGVNTHRFSWELHNGPIPGGLFVLHRCDNKKCVRPDHLFLGSNADNMRDKALKGRAHRLRGEAHPRAKLTLNQVKAIRALHRLTGATTLGHLYGVSESQISSIVKFESWTEEAAR